VTPNDLLSLKADVDVPSVGNKQKTLGKKLILCWSLGRKEQVPDPLPTDPRIRIRIKFNGSGTLFLSTYQTDMYSRVTSQIRIQGSGSVSKCHES
jgi:hypothetical protein